jgi:multidrug efflux pump subunit AcrA (membrane-fusion protein)
MQAEVDINEADIAKVGIGSPAAVVLDSYPDKQFDTALVKVYPAADRQRGTVKIEVQIARPDLQIIKPEMSAKVSFLVPKMKNGDEPRLTVPKSAIHIEGTESYVWTVRDGMAKRATIVRGRETEAGIEVTQGVKDGDIVIIGAAVALKDGLEVRSDQSGSAFGKAQTAGTK